MAYDRVVLPHERWAIAEYKNSLAVARRVLLSPTRGKKSAVDNAWTHIFMAEQLLDRRLGTMATDKKRGKDFTFEGWVNIRLTDEDKATLEHILSEFDPADLLDWLGAMAYGGYSFSVSWDDWSDAQQVSLVCKDPDDANYGYGMSARHPDLDVAIMTLRYKHVQIADHKWLDVAPSPRGNSWG